MSSTTIERDRAGVVTLAIGDGEGVNTLTRELIARLRDELGALARDPEVRVVVVTGSGSSFIAGADIKELLALPVDGRMTLNQELLELNETLRLLPVPTIACLNGSAFGGGLELALACSIRVAAAGSSLGLPEPKVGLMPGSGGVVRLPRLIGPGPALRLLLTGDPVPAERALELGLVDDVAPADGTLERALQIAAAIARNSPLAIRTLLAAFRETAGLPEGEAVRAVHGRIRVLFDSADLEEGLSAFLEKRAPAFGSAPVEPKEE